MIQNEGKNIICSYGDTFTCSWLLNAPEIEAGSEVIFSIKKTAESTEIIKSKSCNLQGNSINVTIESAEFTESVPVGSYVYDLVLKKDNRVTTLLFPANFIVKAVVHSD